METLIHIKRMVLAGRVIFTDKAEVEMFADGLTPELICESIINAPAVSKSLRSHDPRTGRPERLYVIKGWTYDGLGIYTKGKIVTREGVEFYYVLVSSKKTTDA